MVYSLSLVVIVGDQVEVMLQEEAEAKAAAASELAALQQQRQQAGAEAAAQQRQQEQLSQQLAAAEQALQAAERSHKKALKKLDRKMMQVSIMPAVSAGTYRWLMSSLYLHWWTQ